MSEKEFSDFDREITVTSGSGADFKSEVMLESEFAKSQAKKTETAKGEKTADKSDSKK